MDLEFNKLAKNLEGELHWTPLYQGIYATDASNYQIFPEAVAYPKTETDLKEILDFARKHHLPVLPRGGGTSLVGQTVGKAIILDFTKFMNQILEINVQEKWCWVQPGVIRDELNLVLKQHRIHFAPDPATSSRAAIGGMIANNSSGTRSILYGKTLDHVLELRIMLYNGNTVHCTELSTEELEEKFSNSDLEGEIYRNLLKTISENREDIIQIFPKVMRRVGGYNLDEFLETPWNLSRLIVGSEGTLAIITACKIRLVDNPKHQVVSVLHFDDFYDSISHIAKINQFNPASVELLDELLIQKSRENLETKRYCGFIEGNPKAALVVEFYGETIEDAKNKCELMIGDLQNSNIAYAHPIFTDPVKIEEIFTVRKKGLGLLMGVKGNKKPIAFIEDSAVPVEHLAEYIREVYSVCSEENTAVIAYAHASVGLLHVKPLLDLRDPEDIERMKRISLKTLNLVKKYGGSWSGEHGDGLARGPYNELFFGTKLYEAFIHLKKVFDPLNIMNPGKIVNTDPQDKNLRYGIKYKDSEFKSQFQYREEGSFNEAVHLCNGVGECRKNNGGVMCPSFRMSQDEKDSTRARANALRLALSGQLDPLGLESDYLVEVLELCLSCKACKSECPSSVDMSKFKSEIHYLHKNKYGYNRLDQLVKFQESLSKLSTGIFNPLINQILKSEGFRWLLEKYCGIDKRRILPLFNRSIPIKNISSIQSDESAEVLLFVDCYMKYHEPEILKKSILLLQHFNYKVYIYQDGCCQRPNMSRGLLKEAKKKGLRTFIGLEKYLDANIPLLVTEPSCASALKDDLADLMPDPKWSTKASGINLIEDFLVNEISLGKIQKSFPIQGKQFLLHGHCHQKSYFTTQSVHKLFSKTPNIKFSEINSGCCGMAGMFGYEKKNYTHSEKIGNISLFPEIIKSEPDTTILAEGFSCRHQIEHFTGRKPIHWIEAISIND